MAPQAEALVAEVNAKTASTLVRLAASRLELLMKQADALLSAAGLANEKGARARRSAVAKKAMTRQDWAKFAEVVQSLKAFIRDHGNRLAEKQKAAALKIDDFEKLATEWEKRHTAAAERTAVETERKEKIQGEVEGTLEELCELLRNYRRLKKEVQGARAAGFLGARLRRHVQGQKRLFVYLRSKHFRELGKHRHKFSAKRDCPKASDEE